MSGQAEMQTVAADLRGVRTLRQWLRAALTRRELPDSVIHPMLSAISELGLNAVLHPRPPAQKLQLRIEFNQREVTVDLACDSASFTDIHDLRAAARPVSESDPLAESGRGLSLVLASFPDLEYRARGATDRMEHFSFTHPVP